MQRIRQPRRPAGVRVLLIVALCLTFVSGIVVGSSARFAEADTPLENVEAFRTFEEVWNLILEQYVDPASVDPDTLIYGAIRGMVEAVGDTGHTGFINPEEAAARDVDLQGEYVGVGVEFDYAAAFPLIIDVFPNSPAEAAGLQRGDIVRAVDGVDLYSLRDDEIGPYFLGAAGEPITLTILRGDGPAFDVELTREVIEVDPVQWWMIEGNVAHVRYRGFTDGSAIQLREAIDEAIAAGAESFILDLRNNGGGLLNELVRVVAIFLPTGTPIFQDVDREGRRTMTRVRNGSDFDYPLVVLTNRRTASSAEITAGAISEAGVGVTLGDTTYGTGTGLASIDFDDGSHLSLGVVLWQTPSGRNIWKVGLPPDVPVEMLDLLRIVRPNEGSTLTRAELDAGPDIQLQAAVSLLLDGADGQ